jgi:hypothetical protein
MAELDYRKLNVNVGKLRIVKSAALELAESKLQDSKKQLLNEFSSHPVTVEIEGGESSSNTSGTLGGYGNLFSFIGFPSSFNPIDPVLKLVNKIKLTKSFIRQTTKSGPVFSFKISAPTISEFESATPMPWAVGRSWLTGIERGISGLGYFISRLGTGRSEGGQQADNKIRQTSFNRTSYFSKMYSDFFRRLKRNK